MASLDKNRKRLRAVAGVLLSLAVVGFIALTAASAAFTRFPFAVGLVVIVFFGIVGCLAWVASTPEEPHDT